jgi:uncharacterized membrane protein YphA (DoxX/SURF4 family)
MFSTFPDGLPGIGLVLLRAALGGLLAIKAITYLREHSDLKSLVVTLLLLIVVSGVLLIAGYRTRVVAIAATLTIVASMILLSRTRFPDLLDTRTTEAFAIVIGAAVACLGPGAFSLDSRLFGRREIIIPKSSPKD